MTLIVGSTALALGNTSGWPLQKKSEKNERANNNNINNGNRTEWSPIWTVIIQVTKQNRTTAKRESDLLITSMIANKSMTRGPVTN